MKALVYIFIFFLSSIALCFPYDSKKLYTHCKCVNGVPKTSDPFIFQLCVSYQLCSIKIDSTQKGVTLLKIPKKPTTPGTGIFESRTDLEIFRLFNETYRIDLESLRESKEAERQQGIINSKEYNSFIKDYHKGIQDYRINIQNYKTFSNNL